jgi:hypothetical protein
VAVADDLVVLDVRRDAYFCLVGAGRALVRLPDGRQGVTEAGVAGAFREAGLLGDAAAPAPSFAHWPPPPRPTASAVADVTPRPGWGDLAPALSGLWDVVTLYRGRPFAEVLQAVAAPHGLRRSAPPGPDLLAHVQAFHRWAPYAPVSGKCLLRSFMLRRLLARAGHDVLWVFGVSTWPFRAHCWLQCGEVALDESVDHLAAFAPILAV